MLPLGKKIMVRGAGKCCGRLPCFTYGVHNLGMARALYDSAKSMNRNDSEICC